MKNKNPKLSIAIVLKGYPRLSETFIAQELKELEKHQFELLIFSLRKPTDITIHPIHKEIQANVNYLPEYIHSEPIRVIRAIWKLRRIGHVGNTIATWLKDLRRDFTRNRIRRLAQAFVMAAELPVYTERIYAHFMHTPGSVARYTSLLLLKPWGFSAHAKDIWTIPTWEKIEKLNSARFAVTCTQANLVHLNNLSEKSNVKRVYHGLDFARFPDPGLQNSDKSGNQSNPVTILSVGRAVSKKGYPILLRALAGLSSELHWKLIHIGGGKDSGVLQKLSRDLGIDNRISWQGAQPQELVLQAYRRSDIFVLASVIDPNGDRDGLPNVLMEAQSQRLCCIATSVSGIPELIRHDETGLLVESGSPEQLTICLDKAIRNPRIRNSLANAGFEHVRRNFSQDNEISTLISLLERM